MNPSLLQWTAGWQGMQEARVSAESADSRVLPEASPASAIMEQHGFGALGCMSILTQPFAAPPKRLIRTLKPAFGSSFNVRTLDWEPD